MNLFKNKSQSQSGFTLLLAALVASIVVAIGAAIYSIATKELNLSSVGRDSQFAFYAADTSSECALYYDINRQWFSTSSPPANIACGGATTTVTSTSATGGSSNGSASYTVPGSYTFNTPAQYQNLTVTVNGAGGGGGGGANCNLGNATAGTAGTGNTSFNGTVVAGPGGGGPKGPLSCTGSVGSGSNGSAVGGDTNTPGGGASGGTGGANSSGNAPGTPTPGGNGGKGGLVVKTYSVAALGTNAPITVVVGGAGNGGNPGGGAAQPGGAGTNGSVLITWTGAAPVWQSTTFSFQTQINGTCAITTFIKALVAGSITNDIHSDGSNVPCSATTTSPRALQRSVEIKY